jgi:hypothetical protein
MTLSLYKLRVMRQEMPSSSWLDDNADQIALKNTGVVFDSPWVTALHEQIAALVAVADCHARIQATTPFESHFTINKVSENTYHTHDTSP